MYCVCIFTTVSNIYTQCVILCSCQHIYSHILYTNPETHCLFLFPIIWETDVFQIEGFKRMLTLHEVTFFASLKRDPDSTIPHTHIYFP